jgi:hypothetical protein
LDLCLLIDELGGMEEGLRPRQQPEYGTTADETQALPRGMDAWPAWQETEPVLTWHDSVIVDMTALEVPLLLQRLVGCCAEAARVLVERYDRVVRRVA